MIELAGTWQEQTGILWAYHNTSHKEDNHTHDSHQEEDVRLAVRLRLALLKLLPAEFTLNTALGFLGLLGGEDSLDELLNLDGWLA